MTTLVPKQRVPELEGLRGVAVSLVVVFHYISQEGQLAQGTFPALLQRFVIMGWTGVDLFWCCPDF